MENRIRIGCAGKMGQSKLATSYDTNRRFVADGTTVIKTVANTRQNMQATSNYTKQMFMILTFDGTPAIKTAATTRRKKQATSKHTKEEDTHDKST